MNRAVPGFKAMNPEFKRNLWQELSLQRLIAMPAILLAIFFVAYLKYDLTSIPNTAFFLILLLTVVWGSGLSADAIFEEIREHTWDAQRMTPLGPWSMTWGKLLGSTIFVWYGALWCLLAIAVSLFNQTEISYPNLTYAIVYHLLTGIFTQAFAFFLAILFQRISPLRTRARVVLIQLFAIAVGLILFSVGRNGLPELYQVHSWYNLDIAYQKFVIGTQIFLTLSLIFGIYRLLRHELQMRSFPWAWLLFLLIWIVYLVGFTYSQTEKIPRAYFHVLWAAIAYGVLIKGSFLSAFFTPKNIVHYFRWFKNIKMQRFVKALYLTPSWVLTLILAIFLLFLLIYLLLRPDFPESKSVLANIGFSTSLLFFLFRDIGLLYYLTFDIHAKRAHMATVVYLVVLYTLLPILLSFTPLPNYWYPALAPWAWFTQIEPITTGQIMFINTLVFVQAALAWGLVFTRWQRAKKQLA